MTKQLATAASILILGFLAHSIVFANDINLADGCTLADAISAANDDAAVGACPAGNGADVIRLTGDVVLHADLPEIDSDLTIEGDGYTIDGDNKYRVFYIVFDREVTINDLTLTGGSNKRYTAITTFPGVKLTINNSRFTDNHAPHDGGVIDSVGTFLTILNSVFENNSSTIGGVILNVMFPTLDEITTMTIADSSFQNNLAGYAGVLHNLAGSVNISNSAFVGNRAESDSAKGAPSETSLEPSTFATAVSPRTQGRMVARFIV